jgi:hypothetical protein
MKAIAGENKSRERIIIELSKGQYYAGGICSNHGIQQVDGLLTANHYTKEELKSPTSLLNETLKRLHDGGYKARILKLTIETVVTAEEL